MVGLSSYFVVHEWFDDNTFKRYLAIHMFSQSGRRPFSYVV